MGRFNVQKLVLLIGIVAIGLGGVAGLALFSLPVTPLFGDRGLAAVVTPVESARAAGGRALINAGSGTDILRWYWCPVNGINVFCFQSSGYRGFYRGEIAVLFTGATIGRLDFSRLPPGALGVGGLPAGTTLSGELNDLVFDWGDGCLHRALIGSRGEVSLSGPAGKSGPVAIEGDRNGGIDLRGQTVNGHLDLAGNRITGTLRMATPGNMGTADHSIEVNVARGVSCL